MKYKCEGFTVHAVEDSEGSYQVFGKEDTLVAELKRLERSGLWFCEPLTDLCKMDRNAVSYFLNNLNTNFANTHEMKDYVYLVVVEGILKYVGKGCLDRWKHTISGTSHVKALNADYFKGKEICVYIAKAGMEADKALLLESTLIQTFTKQGFELYNTQGVASKRGKYEYINVDKILSASRLVAKYKGIDEEI